MLRHQARVPRGDGLYVDEPGDALREKLVSGHEGVLELLGLGVPLLLLLLYSRREETRVLVVRARGGRQLHVRVVDCRAQALKACLDRLALLLVLRHGHHLDYGLLAKERAGECARELFASRLDALGGPFLV